MDRLSRSPGPLSEQILLDVAEKARLAGGSRASTAHRIEEAGVQIVGISDDLPAVLERASDRLKITFPLLSDPESRMIDAFPIRNEAAKCRAVGVPYPGTFILDRQGVIRAKLFLEGYRDRHTTDALIEAAMVVR